MRHTRARLAALRRGRQIDTATDLACAARSVRAARAARGSGGLAQCDSDARGWRDCALAAERVAAVNKTEKELLDAARHGDEGAFSQLIGPHRAGAARPLL